jgi:hypothetical protein
LVVLVAAAALVVALLPLTAGARVIDTQAPVVSAVLATPNPVNLPGHVHLTATVDDTTMGASVIASADYQVGSGAWLPMTAVDGAFDEVAEDVEVTFTPAATGTFVLGVRGEDALMNTSAPVTVSLSVLPRPTVSVADKTVTEGTGGLTPMSFKVTPTAASTESFSVDYSVEGGTAIAGKDFQAVTPGTLTWVPGDAAAKYVTVQVIADPNDEANESLSITLHNPVHVNLGDPTANGTITDDDPMPVISIADTSIREPAKGYVLVPVHVTLTVASGKQVTVRFSTANGSAKAGRDYVFKAGTLTFLPGRTARVINIKVLGDDEREPNQAFYVNLFGPTNATLGHSVATVVIRNFG